MDSKHYQEIHRHNGGLVYWTQPSLSDEGLLARKLFGRVFILSPDGERQVHSIYGEQPDIIPIYPLFRSSQDFSCRIDLPCRMVYAFGGHMVERGMHPIHSLFARIIRPYTVGESERQFTLDDDLYVLLKMRF